MVQRLVLGQVVEHRLGHPRRELVGAEAVAATDDGRVAREAEQPLGHRFAKGGTHVVIERLAQGAGLLGAVEHRDLLHRLRQHCGEALDVERQEQPDLDQADLFALAHQVLDQLMHGVAPRTHHDDDAFGFRVADIVEQMVLTTGQLGELVELGLQDAGHLVVVAVDRFPPLEIDIRVLGAAAQHRVIRGQGPGTVGADQLVADHVAHVVVRQGVNLLHLMGSAEPIEVVQEGDPRFEGRGLGDQGEIHNLLDVVGAQEGPAGGAAGHDVGVVAENRQGLGSDGACRDVEDRRGQFTSDLEHVGDHQQQPLGSGEGRGQGPGLQRPVHGPGSAAFRLHFNHLGDGPPDVLLAHGALHVGNLAHDR